MIDSVGREQNKELRALRQLNYLPAGFNPHPIFCRCFFLSIFNVFLCGFGGILEEGA